MAPELLVVDELDPMAEITQRQLSMNEASHPSFRCECCIARMEA